MTAAAAPLSEVVVNEIDRLATNYADAFAPECVKILDKNKDLRPLVLNRVQRAVGAAEGEELQRRGKARLYVLKGRQGGVTTDQQARALHLCWSTPGAIAFTLAHKREAMDRIFENITQVAVKNFPRELLPKLGGRATREIAFTRLDSHFYTETAGSGNAMRGGTVSRLHCSEFAFYEDPRTILKAAAPAMVPNGSVVVLETTASAYGSEAHEFWIKSENGKTGYRALFFPWWVCDPKHYRTPLLADDELGKLEDDEQNLVDTFGLTLEEIKWRREMIGEMGRAEFLQEYPEDPESCWMAAGSMFYNGELLKRLLQRATLQEPVAIEENGALEIYSELQDGERCIIGVDTAEGGAEDSSTWVARAFPSWRKLSVYQSRDVEPKDFARLLDTWGRRYGVALLVVEKNAHGITVLRELRDDHCYPVEFIYHRQTFDDETAIEGVRGKIGWWTSKESKPLLLDAGRELFNACRDGFAEVPNVQAIRDAFNVHRDENGKVELNGRDVLVAEMLAWIGRSAPIPELIVL